MDSFKPIFSYFGSKRAVAPIIWKAFGKVDNYIEPFCGSLAVLLGSPEISKVETVNDIDHNICIGPKSRILMRDLTWKNAEDLVIEDNIFAFDEYNLGEKRVGLRAASSYRKWRHATVTNIMKIKLPSYKLTFDDGTTIIASENHCWLTGSHCTGKGGRGWRWVKTKSLVCNRKTQRSWLLKLVDVTEKENTYDAGWLGGLYDGEGNLHKNPGLKIAVSQNDRAVLSNIERLLKKYKFEFFINKTKKCKQLYIKGGMKEQLRFLMLTRPLRLINNFIKKTEGTSIYGRKHSAVGLVKKEFLGETEVIALSTSTKTFVAEGLASHNCNFWRAVSNDADKVQFYADAPVNEADLHAKQIWLENQVTPEFKKRMHEDIDFCDYKMAGAWIYGKSGAISGNWMERKGLTSTPSLSSAGEGINGRTTDFKLLFKRLQERLRLVRVCCGDWRRVCTPSVTYKNKAVTKDGYAAIFLDPPYSTDNRNKVYLNESNIYKEVCEWAISNYNPKLKIAVCGYENDYNMPDDWQIYHWKTNGGMSSLGKGIRKVNGKINSGREVIYFSPNCNLV